MLIELLRIAGRDASKRRGATVVDAVVGAAVGALLGPLLSLEWWRSAILGLAVGGALFGIQFAVALFWNFKGRSRDWAASYSTMHGHGNGVVVQLYLNSTVPYALAQARPGHLYACVVRGPTGDVDQPAVGTRQDVNGLWAQTVATAPGRFQVRWYAKVRNDKRRPELVHRFRLPEDEFKRTVESSH